jgi:hypothetical protein
MAGTQKEAVWYHSPYSPNLKIALPGGQWAKFQGGNICIAADDPLRNDKIKAIEENPNFGRKEDGAKIFKAEESIRLNSPKSKTVRPLNTPAGKWHATGMQKLYPEGRGTWFTCDACGRKVATLEALELHACREHGEEYWKQVEKQAQPPRLKNYGSEPETVKIGRIVNEPPKEPDPEPAKNEKPDLKIPPLGE